MNEPEKPQRTLVCAASIPTLSPHVRLRHDTVRDRWTILGPERVFSPDAIAIAVLNLCDNRRTVDGIAAELAQAYSAPKERILADIIVMLQDLTDKDVVRA